MTINNSAPRRSEPNPPYPPEDACTYVYAFNQLGFGGIGFSNAVENGARLAGACYHSPFSAQFRILMASKGRLSQGWRAGK